MTEKEYYQNKLLKIVNPLKPYYDGGFVRFGGTMAWYENISADIEAFLRPLWGLVPFWAGGGEADEFTELYRNGLGRAADWGECHDNDQRFVEMAAIAYGIFFARGKVWDALTEDEKSTLEGWLLTINDNSVCDCNWIFFRVLVNLALKTAGRKYSEERIDADLKRIDDFYIGGGWYTDGEGGQCDYYIAFAMHFYGLLVSMFDESRADKYRSRAMEFAKDFIYWFNADGEAMPYGRSLTYRFAQVSFWGMCIVAGIEPFPIGVMKGIIFRNLALWEGAFDESGLLTIGYKYPNINIAEHYNAHGSPYWSLKVFAFLMLDDDHKFWSTPCEPMPYIDGLKHLEKPGMLIMRSGGRSVMYPSGRNINLWQGQGHNKYLKFAYSPQFGFNVTRGVFSIEESGGDSMLVFVVDGVCLFRKHTYKYRVTDTDITIVWSPFNGIEVETVIIPTETGHIRRHKINSVYDCTAYDMGFAVAARDRDNTKTTADGNTAIAENGFQRCEITGSGEGIIVGASPNTNILYPKTVIPAIKYAVGKGETAAETTVTA